MDTAADMLFALSNDADWRRVAAAALGEHDCTLTGRPVVDPITAPRADPRTIGVVKVSGEAQRPDGRAATWSAVAKMVRLTEHFIENWTRPEIEEVVYEERYFAEDGLRFRPARCYLVSRPAPDTKIFWLEDLSAAGQAPFSVAQLGEMAEHLGEWSAFHREAPALKFALPRDLFAVRWAQRAFVSRYERLHLVDPVLLKRCFGEVPVAMLHELRAGFLALGEMAKGLPHCLAFGDCQVGNLFHRPGETVAVDWASLGYDPIGADAGAMVGSMLGRPGGAEIAAHERALFESYVEGLEAGGWRGAVDDVRRGYLCQFGHYLANTMGSMAVIYAFDEWPRADLELRMRAPFDALPELTARVVAFYPQFLEEVRALAAP